MTTATITTSKGAIKVELYTEQAPKTTGNFIKLAKEGFYDNLVFHRVIADFMVQGGCPDGTGTGGPGYTFDDEASALAMPHDGPGRLSMANAGPNTNGSQFLMPDRIPTAPNFSSPTWQRPGSTASTASSALCSRDKTSSTRSSRATPCSRSPSRSSSVSRQQDDAHRHSTGTTPAQSSLLADPPGESTDRR